MLLYILFDVIICSMVGLCVFYMLCLHLLYIFVFCMPFKWYSYVCSVVLFDVFVYIILFVFILLGFHSKVVLMLLMNSVCFLIKIVGGLLVLRLPVFKAFSFGVEITDFEHVFVCERKPPARDFIKLVWPGLY